jgi:hypothetical protein
MSTRVGKVGIKTDGDRVRIEPPKRRMDASKKIGLEKSAKRGADAWIKAAKGRATVTKRGK